MVAWYWIRIALWIGSTLGILTMGLLRAAADSDPDVELEQAWAEHQRRRIVDGPFQREPSSLEVIP